MSTEGPPSSSTRLQRALSAARMAAWEFDVTTGELECSSGSNSQPPFFLDERAFTADLFDHAHNAAGPYTKELRLEKPDGSVVWLRAQGDVVHDEQGRPARIIGIVLDITEHRQTDELLRKISAGVSVATGEAFFRLLARSLC